MLGDTVGSSSFAMATLWGIAFGTVPLPLMSTVSPSLQMHTYVARGTTMFSKRPRERVAGASPSALGDSHFGELLEDHGSRPKEAISLLVLVRT